MWTGRCSILKNLSATVSISCMEEFGIEGCDDANAWRYADVNRACWEALERGEMTKPEVLVGRFRRFFAQEGITCSDVKAFNDSYQRKLGEIFLKMKIQ